MILVTLGIAERAAAASAGRSRWCSSPRRWSSTRGASSGGSGWGGERRPIASPAGPRPARGAVAGAGALLVFLVSFLLDVRTIMPGLGYWDTGEFQTLGPVLGIAHPTGYPSYTLLLWLASVVLQPFGEPAFRANLLSALLVSGAAAFTAIAIVQLTRKPVLASLGGIALAVAPIAWRNAVRADPHAFQVFLVAPAAGAAHRVGGAGTGAAARRTLARGGIGGLRARASTNHGLTIALAPGVAAVRAARPAAHPVAALEDRAGVRGDAGGAHRRASTPTCPSAPRWTRRSTTPIPPTGCARTPRAASRAASGTWCWASSSGARSTIPLPTSAPERRPIGRGRPRCLRTAGVARGGARAAGPPAALPAPREIVITGLWFVVHRSRSRWATRTPTSAATTWGRCWSPASGRRWRSTPSGGSCVAPGRSTPRPR